MNYSRVSVACEYLLLDHKCLLILVLPVSLEQYLQGESDLIIFILNLKVDKLLFFKIRLLRLPKDQ